MAKKSHRRPARYENQSGCMWGFISILDFRSRSTRKLLSDRKHWRYVEGNTSNKFEVLADYDEDGQNTAGGNKSVVASAGAGKPSVKKLMEEEMFGEQDSSNKEITNAEVERKQVDDGSHKTKGQKRKKKTGKKSGNVQVQCQDANASTNMGSRQSCIQDSEQQSVSDLNFDAIIKEFCSQIHQESLKCEEHDLNGEVEMKSNSKHSGYEENFCEAVKVFMNQKFCSEENGKFPRPKELIDALEILNSDKELLLKLLQDPNSMLLKSGQNLKDVGEEKDEKSKLNQEIGSSKTPDQLIIRKKHNFFRRKVKSPETNSMLNENEDSQGSNRIVILKPGPTGLQNPETETTLMGSRYIIKSRDPSSERVASQFSFSELKRRLKHAIGKEHQSPGNFGKGAMGENVGMNSPTKDHFFMERVVKPSTGTRMKDKASKSKGSDTANDSKQRVSNIYIEAKKHLSDMLSNGDEDENTSTRLVQKSLGRILSLPEYNSPTDSPVREQERNFTNAQTRLSISDNMEGASESSLQLEEENKTIHPGPLTENMVAQTCISGSNSIDDSLALNLDQNISKDIVCEDEKKSTIPIGDETSSEVDVEIVKTTDAVAKEEGTIVIDAPSESVSSFITTQIGEISETFDGKGYSEGSKEDVYEENQPQSPPCFSIAKKVEDPEDAMDIPDRPSPVSVLEPLFTENETSPASTACQPVELPIQPLQIQFEEHESSDTAEGTHLKTCRSDKESVLDYVKAVLQASGLNQDELYIRSLSSNQLLNPTLFNEIEFSPNQLCHDPKLLFDCINEVLMEVYGHHFGFSSWVSFVKPSIRPVPNMKNGVQRVWEGVCWHLLPQPLPRTLEQIVGKDMTKSGTWMDLRFDVDGIGIEMCEVIFEELIEDTILSCVTEVPRSGDSVVPIELKETEEA